MPRNRRPRLDPFANAHNGLSPLAEFVVSCEGELPYLEAVREYQEDWCEHPEWNVISTRYAPTANHFEHVVECRECGLVKYKNGKARVHARR